MSPAPERKAIQTVTLTLFRFGTTASRAWAFAMMALARPPLARLPGLSFWKLCGAGSGAGFTPRLDMRTVAILCVWDNRADADAALGDNPLFARYRDRSEDCRTLYLSPLSARGAWSGRTPFTPLPDTADGPFAVLTRATLRPRSFRNFWARVPGVSDAIAADPNVRFRIGLGEVPFLHQITFSIWPDLISMRAFAHQGGPHRAAIDAVRDGAWFREELYARFRVTGMDGAWDATHPIEDMAE